MRRKCLWGNVEWKKMKNYNCDYTARIGQRQKNEVNYLNASVFPEISTKGIYDFILGAQNYVLKKESLVLMVGWGDRIKKTNKKNGKTGLDSVSLAASGPACKPFHSRRHRAAWAWWVRRGRKQWDIIFLLRADAAELTWLAKMRDITVLSLGFLVMQRMSCSMGVIPGTQLAGRLAFPPLWGSQSLLYSSFTGFLDLDYFSHFCAQNSKCRTTLHFGFLF